jgi:hypothetical protein
VLILFKENIVNASTRLHELQSALSKQGVKDVKFFFSGEELAAKPKSVIESGVSNFLDAYYCARYKKSDRVGDAPISK